MSSKEQINFPPPGDDLLKSILDSLQQLHPLRILVVGDLFLDIYTEGTIDRISPEAPVAILSAVREFAKPGGAGNVALNLAAMGNSAFLLGRIGRDAPGLRLKSLLSSVDTGALFMEEGIATGQKQRILSHRQQLLRIDREQIEPLSPRAEEYLLQRATELLPTIDIIAISDYGKGNCPAPFLAKLMDCARHFGCPVVVDPKGDGFGRYSGATIIKPNLSELYAAADPTRALSPKNAAAQVLKTCGDVNWLLVTLSEQGMSLGNAQGEWLDIPAQSVQINDVTGAGDTALAMLTHSWGCGLAPDQCAHLANRAAGIAVQRVGCAQVSLSEIAHSIVGSFAHRKSSSHLTPLALKALFWGQRAALIAIDKGGLTTSHLNELLELVEHRKISDSAKVAIYCPEELVAPEILRLMESLKQIDFLFRRSGDLVPLIDAAHWSPVYHWIGERFEEGSQWLAKVRKISKSALAVQ